MKLSDAEDIEKDITRKRQPLFCFIKLIEIETEKDIKANELMVIGFMIKNNFDNISIDFDIEEDVTKICLD